MLKMKALINSKLPMSPVKQLDILLDDDSESVNYQFDRANQIQETNISIKKIIKLNMNKVFKNKMTSDHDSHLYNEETLSDTQNEGCFLSPINASQFNPN